MWRTPTPLLYAVATLSVWSIGSKDAVWFKFSQMRFEERWALAETIYVPVRSALIVVANLLLGVRLLHIRLLLRLSFFELSTDTYLLFRKFNAWFVKKLFWYTPLPLVSKAGILTDCFLLNIDFSSNSVSMSTLTFSLEVTNTPL